MLMVLFNNLIHKKINPILATYDTWKYKIVKIIFHLSLKKKIKI